MGFSVIQTMKDLVINPGSFPEYSPMGEVAPLMFGIEIM
jgi:hypothetical protein